MDIHVFGGNSPGPDKPDHAVARINSIIDWLRKCRIDGNGCRGGYGTIVVGNRLLRGADVAQVVLDVDLALFSIERRRLDTDSSFPRANPACSEKSVGTRIFFISGTYLCHKKGVRFPYTKDQKMLKIRYDHNQSKI